MKPRSTSRFALPSVIIVAALGVPLVQADPNPTVDFAWNQNASSIWGTTTNWTPASGAGGPDAADIFVAITNDINGGTRTITLYNTGDAGNAIKTVGRLDIGDASNSFTIAAGTGLGVLDFSVTSGSAILNLVAGAASSTLASVSLTSNLNVNNAASSSLLITAVTGAGTMTINNAGSGSVDIGNVNNSGWSGGATLTAGTLRVAHASGSLGTGTVALNGGTLSSATGTSKTVTNAFTLGGNVTLGQTVGGTGALTFTGTTTLSGARTITTDAGVVYGATGTGDFISASTDLLTKGGASSLTFSNTNRTAFNGGLHITSGTLINANTNSSGASLTNLVFGDGLIRFAGGTTYQTINAPTHNNIQLDGVLTIIGDSGGGNVKRFLGNISGVGSLLATSNGGTSTIINLSGANTFGGGVTMTETGAGSPVLIAVSTNALGTGVTTLNNGQLRIGGVVTSASAGTTAADQNIDGLAGEAATSVVGYSSVVGGSTITISPTTGSNTYAGTIGGVGTNNNNLSIVMNGAVGTTQILTGTNTYTGNTTVISGTLALADNGELAFAIGATSGTNNTLTGDGTVTLEGDFNINTALPEAALLTSGSWVLENVASLTGAYGTNFQVLSGVTPWSVSGEVWTKTVGAQTYSFNEADGTLTLTSSGSPYTTWSGGAGFYVDTNNDGVPNGLAWILGAGSPTANALGFLPTPVQSGGNLTMTFTQVAPMAPAKLFVEYSSDLGITDPWHSVEVPAAIGNTTDIGSGVMFSISAGVGGPPTNNNVSLTVPASKSAGGKLFGRLRSAE